MATTVESPWNFSLEFNDTDFFFFFTGGNNSTTTPMPLAETVLIGIVLGCIILVTIGGNVLVLLAVYVNSHLRSTTNYFIVNLATADLLLGITVLPFSATLESLKYWPFGYSVCDVWASADVLWCTASIMTLCVISIDRYIGVTRPLQHSTIITQRRAVIIIISVWVLSVIISVAPLIGWKESGGRDPDQCTVTKQTGYVIFSVAGSFYIPLSIIVIVYARIYREATKHTKFINKGIKTTKVDQNNGVVLRIHIGRNSHSHMPTLTTTAPSTNNYQSSSSSEHSEGSGRKMSSRLTLAGKIAKFKKEKKAAKTLGIVVGVFIICWFPFFFCLPLDVLCESCRIPEEFFTVIFWLGYCNSMMNPIIYASSSREFKRAFVRIIRCQFKRKPRSFLSSTSGSMTELRKLGATCYKPRLSSVSQHSNTGLKAEDETLAGLCYARQNSESPMMALRVFQSKNARLSNNNLRASAQFEDASVTSELADDETSDLSFCNYGNASRKSIQLRLSPHSDSNIGSFAQDENYIEAFRNQAQTRV